MRGVEDAGFTECTPIQAQTLPLALEGHDIAGQAQTGTGKTAAFLIAAYSQLLRNPRRYEGAKPCPRAFIIAPTRELAMQIREEAELLGKYCDFNIQAVYGGVDYDKQRELLTEGVDVLIGTPGRLIDYYKQHVYTLEGTEMFIADEADRMFDMGFIDDLRFLIRAMPPASERISFLYSATLSHRVLELAYEHMKENEVKRVAIDESQLTAERVEQMVYHVGMREKLPCLLGLIAREEPTRALVFANTRQGASDLADRLVDKGYNAAALIGDLPQKKRTRILQDFKENKLRFLVATDVASRGLHIDAVSHVFNYDLPQDAEDYVHRIGRTARAGAAGKAFSLACERYVYSLEAIQEYAGISIPHDFPGEDLLVKPAPRGPRTRIPDHQKRNDRDGRRGGGGGDGRRGGGGGGGGKRPPRGESRGKRSDSSSRAKPASKSGSSNTASSNSNALNSSSPTPTSSKTERREVPVTPGELRSKTKPRAGASAAKTD